MDTLRSFAEDPMAHLPAAPDEERIMDPRFIVTFSPGAHYWSVSVGRLRLEPDDVVKAVGEVRELIRTRGRDASVWSVGDSATPAGLAERLLDRGMEREGGSDVLVLTRPPTQAAASVFDVQAVRALEDLLTWIDVSAEAFGWPADDALDERTRAADTFRAEGGNGDGDGGGTTLRLLALDEGRPVAVARASVSRWGLYLGGVATLPSDRGRGAMATLVAFAWDAALRRGTPALVAYGGSMSAPIFAGLGFEKTGEIVHLIDRL
jgi:GNAT superfamily N-acetyltransferase